MSKHKIEVSKRNFNRYHFRTHSLQAILVREGYVVEEQQGQLHVLHGETWVRLSDVDLVKGVHIRPVPAPELEQEPQAATA